MFQQNQQEGGPQQGHQEALLAVVALVVAAVIAPGIAIAALAIFIGLRDYPRAQHREWWLRLTPERPWMLITTVFATVALAATTIWAITSLQHGGPAALLAPALVSAGIGILAAPGAFIFARRRLRELALKGRIRDVLAGENIAATIRRANDELVARSIGLTLDEQTVQIHSVDPQLYPAAPVPVEVDGRIRYGIGVLIGDDMLTDFDRSAYFTGPGCDLLLVPHEAGRMRALIIAESGTGKTELIAGFHAVANRTAMTSVLIDLKGQTADAHRFGDDARAQREYLGATDDVVVVRGGWDFFDCDRNQLLERLMYISPKTTSTDYYEQQMRMVLDIVIDGRGTRPLVTSLEELTMRLADPVAHLGANTAGRIAARKGHQGSQPSDAEEILGKVDAMFAPLREYLPTTGQGWSFSKLRPGSATIVPLNPVKESERLLAQLMLRDLRDQLVARAKTGDTSPLSVIIDEFPQMTEPEDDAADEAARIFETARAANVGLLLAGQTISGFSLQQQMQRRLLGAGVAVFLGRSLLPDDVTEAAGTRFQQEAAGDPWGFSINSARAQQTFRIPPQYVRRMHNGLFWVIHEGAVTRFLALRTRT